MSKSVNYSQEQAVVRKIIYQLAGNPNPEDVSIGEAAAKAAKRVNDLEDRVQTLEAATGINLENAEYKQLSRSAKVKRIRDRLKSKAHDKHNGKASMDYNEVQALFDYHASAGHSVELAKAAAGYNDETEHSTRSGYTYQKRTDANDRVVVDLEKTP